MKAPLVLIVEVPKLHRIKLQIAIYKCIMMNINFFALPYAGTIQNHRGNSKSLMLLK